MEKLIKGVKSSSWREFRSEAAKHGLRAGEFLGYLVEEHSRNERSGKSWAHILSKEKALTENDAAKIKKAIEPFEREFGFE